MRIGIDLDNTIICYDEALMDLGSLMGVPRKHASTKQEIKKFLQKNGRENDWIILQGQIYGPGLELANPYPGFLEFAKKAHCSGHTLFIISHKTKTPFKGPRYRLRTRARKWLKKYKIYEHLIDSQKVYLEDTIEEKIEKIGKTGCDVFIDDLPAILNHSKFPSTTRGILFDPQRQNKKFERSFSSWSDVDFILKELDG